MNRDLYDLSDRLKRLRRRFSEFDHSGLLLEGQDIRTLMDELKELEELALRREHEVSRHRWNRAAFEDHALERAVLTEASRPGTNLRLLARTALPFGDGHPEGRAS